MLNASVTCRGRVAAGGPLKSESARPRARARVLCHYTECLSFGQKNARVLDIPPPRGTDIFPLAPDLSFFD